MPVNVFSMLFIAASTSNLDLNLGISTPSPANGPTENKNTGSPRYHYYDAVGARRLQVIHIIFCSLLLSSTY